MDRSSDPDGPLAGRTLLVAGASGGIGSAIARTLHGAGAKVILHASTRARADAAAAAIAGDGARLIPVHGDLRDLAETRAMLAPFSVLHGLVNAVHVPAGTVSGRFEQTDPAAYAARIEGSFLPLLYLCREALPALRAAEGAAIVSLVSDAGKVAAPGQAVIGGIGAGIMMFLRTLALEYAAHGIRVNGLATTYVRGTPVFDAVMGRGEGNRAAIAMARAKLGLPVPEDLAEMALYLCGDRAARVTGQVISVNGGLSV